MKLDEVERILGRAEDEIAMYRKLVREISSLEKNSVTHHALKIELLDRINEL